MNISLYRYLITFAAIYAGAMVVTNVLTHGFNLDLGAGANIGMLIAAGYGSAMQFVTDHKRAPDLTEKRKLVFGALLVSWLISVTGLVMIVAFLGGNVAKELVTVLYGVHVIVWVVIVLGVSLLYYLLLTLIYGLVARKCAERAASRGKVKH